jgi:hypothetical protein
MAAAGGAVSIDFRIASVKDHAVESFRGQDGRLLR